MPSFADHFSSVATHYASNRPQYPPELFEWLAFLTSDHDRALDVGTGSGQAAVHLSRHYQEVIATDPSAAQLAGAIRTHRVTYEQANAENSGLPSASVDLLTAATAAHWFDHAAFHAEVRRVLKPGGVLAVWHYGEACVTPSVDAVMEQVRSRVEEYWPVGREHVRSGYTTLPFPFPDLSGQPSFACRMLWPAERFLGYVDTWSAMGRATNALGQDPLGDLRDELRRAWGDTERWIEWPLIVRVGRKP